MYVCTLYIYLAEAATLLSDEAAANQTLTYPLPCNTPLQRMTRVGDLDSELEMNATRIGTLYICMCVFVSVRNTME